MIEWYSMKLNPPVFKTIKYCNIKKYKHKYNYYSFKFSFHIKNYNTIKVTLKVTRDY